MLEASNMLNDCVMGLNPHSQFHDQCRYSMSHGDFRIDFWSVVIHLPQTYLNVSSPQSLSPRIAESKP